MIKAFSITDVGKKRQLNQDFVFTSDHLQVGNLPNIFVVADGMGGHKAGDYASKCTVETIVDEVMGNSKEKEPVKILENAIQKANALVRSKSMEDKNLMGMGTTVVVATIYEDNMIVANVGDSRLYLMGESANEFYQTDFAQITRDHSLVEEMVRLGGIDRVEARNHPDKNIITRAIGAASTVNVDFFEVSVKPGDLVLMCSDGLTNMLEDDEIRSILKGEGELKDRALRLVNEANEHGGKDNIAVVLVEIL